MADLKGIAATVPWAGNGKPINVGINALTVNVLCTRHNNSLSPLDAEAHRFFRHVRQALAHVTGADGAVGSRAFLASGDAVELWGIKTLLAHYHGKVAYRDRKPLLGRVVFDSQFASGALVSGEIPPPFGLYVPPATGDLIGLHVGARAITSATHLLGLSVKLCGFEMRLAANRTGFDLSTFELSGHRPWFLDFESEDRRARIVLSWRRPLPSLLKGVRLPAVLAKDERAATLARPHGPKPNSLSAKIAESAIEETSLQQATGYYRVDGVTEVLIHNWYFGPTCVHCSSPIAIVHDHDKGGGRITFAGLGIMDVLCRSCGKRMHCNPGEIRNFQAKESRDFKAQQSSIAANANVGAKPLK